MEKSSKKATVIFYMNSFQEGNHEKILSCLTEDVEWIIHGHKSLKGKEAFDQEIENENFEGLPQIKMRRMTEENEVVIAEGTVLAKPRNSEPVLLTFCDIFEFRDGKIAKLTSFLATVKDD